MRLTTYYICAILLFTTAAVCSASTVEVNVPKGSYYYWSSQTDPFGNHQSTQPLEFKGIRFFTPEPENPTHCYLHVLDPKTGNEAISSFYKLARINFKTSDFKWVRAVKVRVTSLESCEPAAAAKVTIVDSQKKTHIGIIEPTSMGRMCINDIATGKCKVTVNYGPGKKVTRTIDIPAERRETVPTIKIPITGKLDTVKASSVNDDSDGVDFPVILLVLLIIGGVVYIAIKTIFNRGAEVRKMLKDHGIDIPEEEENVKRDE